MMAGMILILSPAKTLNLSKMASALISRCTEPKCSLEKTNTLVQIMKGKSKSELKSLLGVSDNIADTVLQYYDEFEIDSSLRSTENKKAAIFAFDGPAYKGIEAQSCNERSLEYLQDNLRIIDPLYGVLKPLDLIQPYRLEMATKGIMKDLDTDQKSLASWWNNEIASAINSDLNFRDKKYIINLASDEYSSAVDESLLSKQCKVIKVAFQEEGKVVSVHSKRARGLMCRFIAENQMKNPEEIKQFDWEGYKFVPSSSNHETFIFNRSKTWKNNTQAGDFSGNKRKTASSNDEKKQLRKPKK